MSLGLGSLVSRRHLVLWQYEAWSLKVVNLLGTSTKLWIDGTFVFSGAAEELSSNALRGDRTSTSLATSVVATWQFEFLIDHGQGTHGKPLAW
jgi:hypothetical protein